MKDFSFVVTDLVKNSLGELLAVSIGPWEYKTYHYTINENKIDEDRAETYLFKRKSDIKKIRPSKSKSLLIDKMNLNILKNNIGAMAYCLERASDFLLCHIEKEGVNISGHDGFSGLPENMKYISNAGKHINKGLDNYSNYLKLCMDDNVGLYSLSIIKSNIK